MENEDVLLEEIENPSVVVHIELLPREQRERLLKGCGEHRLYWSDEEHKFYLD